MRPSFLSWLPMGKRVRVKICGITSVEDAQHAIAEGADAIGLVFYEPSPRCVSVAVARKICESIPPFVTVVGLFVDHAEADVKKICSQVPLSLLQFHGSEPESFCARFDHPYIKAVRVQTTEDVVNAQKNYSTAQGLLVDTYKEGVPGGTGETFDWQLLPDDLNQPLVLAGGLNPSNVRKAIEHVKPFAVDVSGGVELSKGVKDPDKITLFMKEVSRG